MSGPFRVPAGCSQVVAYGWEPESWGGDVVCWIDALAYWPLFPGLVKKSAEEGPGHWIVTNTDYDWLPEPDMEKLANGEVRLVPVHRGKKYYNRSRRARAIEVGSHV